MGYGRRRRTADGIGVTTIRIVFAAALAALPVLSRRAAAQVPTAVVPAVCATLPGNAALALPLRWSHGTMQVFVDAAMLPPALTGATITGLRLRRPTLPGDVAYPAITRTLTVRGGFVPSPAAQVQGSLLQNRPTNTVVLFGPAPVVVAAAPAPGATTVRGDEFVQIPFTIGLPVAAGTLFLEFEAGDAPLAISTGHWVDGYWSVGGAEQGFVVAVGDGSCTTRGEPTRLAWTAATGPASGQTGQLEVTGVPALTGGAPSPVLVWVGLDPETRSPGPGYLGYGAAMTALDPGLSGCHQWAPLDVSWAGTADAAGRFATSLSVPGAAAAGQRLAVQAAWLDFGRPGFPLAASNGLVLVCNSVQVGPRCSTMFFPAGATVSPWPPFRGQMPVLLLEY